MRSLRFLLTLATFLAAGCQAHRSGAGEASRASADAGGSTAPEPSTPHQPPLLYFSLELCKPYFSATSYQAMGAVLEVGEARQRFPGSYMFTPADGLPHPGVVWLHGSEGGRFSVLSMCNARFLAANGYAALFFCYADCGTDSLPAAIHDVDLQRTSQALAWLKQSPYVGGRKLLLSGASRGAEQAVLLSTLLARKSATDATVVVPDALFAHAPFGTIQGGFNWRWGTEPNDSRWNVEMATHLACLQDDPNGPYIYQDPTGAKRPVSWATSNPACSAKPALAPEDCWQADPAGKFTDPSTGKPFSWLSSLCGVAPDVDPQADTVTAWTWAGGTADLSIGSDIPLQTFLGDAFITQGTEDDVWPYSGGEKYLMQTLDHAGIAYSQSTLQTLTAFPARLPTAPPDRVVFTIFAGEKHLFTLPDTAVEWALELSFLSQHL